MSKEDLAKFEGVIVSTPGGGHYNVQLENGKNVVAKLSGKMKQNKIRCIVGDEVTVGISVYDIAHGIIMFRKNKRRSPPPYKK
ncbi:translation initiation factor IF-1 [bacterium]|nr:translation initiation factor IF-1 [bacterium]